MQLPKEKFYQDRIEHYAERLKILERKTRNIALARLIVFIISLLLLYYFARHDSPAGIVMSIAAGIFLFLMLIRFHARALEWKNLINALLTVNTNEKKATNGDHSAFYGGQGYEVPDHPYSHDLDLFGKGSVYQFLNRASTHAGQKKLASLLKTPYHKKKDIELAQNAIQSLSGQIEWRQKFQAIGLVYQENEEDQEKIEDWSHSRPLFNHLIFKVLVVVIPLMTLAMILFLGFGVITVQIFLIYLVIPWGIAGSFAGKVNSRHTRVGKTTEMLRKYASLLSEIDGLEVESPRIRELQKRINHEGISAGKSIKSLSSILTALDNRLNFVSWALLNGLFLWDILQMIRLEKWQQKCRDDLRTWFDVVAELDVINCMANFKFNDDHTIFPEVVEGDFEIVATDAGHPLIGRNVRVNNEIRIRNGEFLIITGANMAGKSTYLRTIGVNLLLAMCGAPVCASSFRFSPVHIFTSIRTSDSLQDNESYFYAELKRLKVIIETLRKGENLFIILDEILKGTNSKDKHAGSEALLNQLISFKATGIVATHDVLLGNLAEKFPDQIRNHCFEVEIEGSQLFFDYLLKDGVSKNLNATILMREMGITI